MRRFCALLDSFSEVDFACYLGFLFVFAREVPHNDRVTFVICG